MVGVGRMTDAIEELAEVLRQVGARPTLDRLRNFTHPCYSCGTTDEPRELVEIGRYSRPRIGGSCQVGDAIRRPLCADCRAISEPGILDELDGARPERSTWDELRDAADFFAMANLARPGAIDERAKQRLIEAARRFVLSDPHDTTTTGG